MTNKDLELAKKFAKEVLKKYRHYITSIVVMGSVVRKEAKKESDIDIFLILNDATQKITPELISKIDSDIREIAKKISERISVQPSYTLTEFWDYAKQGHPIVYNFIKEGVALYGAEFFVPIKKLLELGKIAPTREAIEKYIESAPKKLMRVKAVKLLMIAEDCYYAIIDTAQAVLMFMGLEPPVPSKVADAVERYLVKPGILEKKYADWIREIVSLRKKIEHKQLTEVSGAFVDEWIRRAEEFVNKMLLILSALEERKKRKVIEKINYVLNEAVKKTLKELNKLDETKPLKELFKKELVDAGKLKDYYLKVWDRLEELQQLAKSKEILEVPLKEIYDLREVVRKLIRDLYVLLKEEKK